MSLITITNNIIDKVRELHGVNCAPYSKGSGPSQPLVDKIFKYCGIPYSRLHDVCGTYGGTYYIDVPNIFRDFDADENDPASYDFHYSDEYIRSIIKCGTKIIYRLGVTIEWGTKQYVSNPPKDFAKWARICEHIIMHYNEGWCNGHHFGIEYWEIWNEPENPPMWTGTREEFLELYRITSKHLKERFPNLKIGGYGSCGFYASFRDNMDDFYKSFITYFDEFLKMCRNNGSPLDFYSWHIYTSDVSEIVKSQEHVKKKLLEYGFDKTESHLNEWNYGGEGQGFDKIETNVAASFCVSSLIAMQNCGISMGNYYVLSRMSTYNGFIKLRVPTLTSVCHAFAAFNKIYTANNVLELKTEDSGIDCIAAMDDSITVVLLSNYSTDKGAAKLKLEGIEASKVQALKLISDDGFEKADFTLENGILCTEMEPYSVYYIVFKGSTVSDKETAKYTF